MIWITLIIYAILFLLGMDLIHGLLGLLLIKFSPRRHPWLYRAGLRCLAMSEIFGKKLLPSRCQLDCVTTQCGNWTCPKYNAYSRKKV